MNEVKKQIDEILKDIKQERDALQVKLHLAKMEASDEWAVLQQKLEKLETKASELGGATAEVSQEIGSAAKQLGVEIRDGFKKIARHF